MVFLHGTDYDSAMNIINNGLSNEHDTAWDCSRSDMIYCRKKSEEDSEFLSISSGQLAAAYKNSISTKIGILSIDIPDEIVDEIVEDDDSCDGTYGCYQILIDDILNNIDKIKLSMNIYGDAYVPYLRPFYLTSISHEYITIEDQLLNAAIRIIEDSSVFLDEIFCYGGVIDHYEL